ncbi:FtsW/RodA/SpoVE family cell cycle protein [Edaphobacillus lindanitolerans]|uniref:Cell division protein FtsW n=1 Tax=Edaphobacillus lindanitolerans TaxID=550447 RepID=A0A1U7PL48_9BACI|nr:putative peptidoglycan glycosyltransferase FtsW [Edaphobacillus lindanitolerans]SIT67828.1 cell division protein FtsW [Edaphobacillus lindanitolerans]
MHALEKRLVAVFFISAVALSLLGVAFVHSAGSYWGEIHYGDSLPFAAKQGIYLAVSATAAVFILKTRQIGNPKLWTAVYIASVLLLAAVLIPGIGAVRNGSQSWIALGPFSLQPAEFAKIAVIGKLASMMSERRGRKVFSPGHFVVILLPAALIMLQPDFGSMMIMVVSAFAILLVGGYPLKFFFGLAGAGAAGIAGLIAAAPYRLDRIKAYLDPWSDPLGTGFQAIQSLMATGPAGLTGFGYGQSRQKFLYLPEPQNDFIFAIIAEETGFIGAVAVIALFFLLAASAIGLAARQREPLSFYMISGMAAMLGFQSFLNIGVVSGLLPVTGVTLPFISYGGSSLLAAWIAAALVLRFASGAGMAKRRPGDGQSYRH